MDSCYNSADNSQIQLLPRSSTHIRGQRIPIESHRFCFTGFMSTLVLEQYNLTWTYEIVCLKWWVIYAYSWWFIFPWFQNSHQRWWGKDRRVPYFPFMPSLWPFNYFLLSLLTIPTSRKLQSRLSTNLYW